MLRRGGHPGKQPGGGCDAAGFDAPQTLQDMPAVGRDLPDRRGTRPWRALFLKSNRQEIDILPDRCRGSLLRDDSPTEHHGASNSTSGWLGTRRAPGALVLFCSDIEVSRVAGMPPYNTVNEPVR